MLFKKDAWTRLFASTFQLYSTGSSSPDQPYSGALVQFLAHIVRTVNSRHKRIYRFTPNTLPQTLFSVAVSTLKLPSLFLQLTKVCSSHEINDYRHVERI